MRDLRNAKLIWVKAALFLCIGVVAAGLVWVQIPTVRNLLLIVLTVWAFCRAYYFAFYVLEKYIDPQFRFSGLGTLASYLLRRRSKAPPRGGKETPPLP